MQFTLKSCSFNLNATFFSLDPSLARAFTGLDLEPDSLSPVGFDFLACNGKSHTKF